MTPAARGTALTWATAAAVLVGSAAMAAGIAGRATWCCWVVASLAHTLLLTCPRLAPASSAIRALGTTAVLAAAALVLAPPHWSDDVARYVLDGRMVASGLHPLAMAPASPKLLDLVQALPMPVNHPALPSIYPPGAEALFGLVFGLGASITSWKALLMLAVAAAAWLDRGGPRVGALPRGLALAGHPLTLLTVASEGHIDAVGLLLAWWFVAARGARWSAAAVGAFAGVAASLKLFPLVWVVGAARPPRWRRLLVAGLTAVVVLGASYAPVAQVGAKSVGSLGTYSTTWQHHASAWSLASAGIDASLAAAGRPASFEWTACTERRERRGEQTWYAGHPTHACFVSRQELASRIARALGLLAVAVVALIGVARRLAPTSLLFAVTLALWLGSPVVHPWYLLWLAPLAAATGSRAGWWFVGTAIAGYFGAASAQDGGAWSDPAWLRWAAYAPVYGLLLFDSVRRAPVVSEAVPSADVQP